ncbi:hypothetical protein HOG48_03865 [Candidatus Peregrinibacteria bacterium]|jgi:hypothetical protein|nr:hypothetical protein [Candidatus Peregrinibacteria bacterium]
MKPSHISIFVFLVAVAVAVVTMSIHFSGANDAVTTDVLNTYPDAVIKVNTIKAPEVADIEVLLEEEDAVIELY